MLSTGSSQSEKRFNKTIFFVKKKKKKKKKGRKKKEKKLCRNTAIMRDISLEPG